MGSKRKPDWSSVRLVKVVVSCDQVTPDLYQRIKSIVTQNGHYTDTVGLERNRPPAPEGAEKARQCASTWIHAEHLKELETELGGLEDEGVSYTVTEAKTQYGERWALKPGELPEKEPAAGGGENKFGFLEVEWTRTDPDETREHTREAKRAIGKGAPTYRGMALGVRSDHLYRDRKSTTRVTGQVHEDRVLGVLEALLAQGLTGLDADYTPPKKRRISNGVLQD